MDYTEQITEIMNEFDFNHVRQAMVALDWVWYTGNGVRIPDIDDLRHKAKALLQDVSDGEEEYFISCGGFRANKSDGQLSLQFVLEEWETKLPNKEQGDAQENDTQYRGNRYYSATD